MNEEQIRERVQAELSQERFTHTQGVVQAVTELAQRYGVDVVLARKAAWIHDVAREWSVQKLEQYAERVEIPAGYGMIPEILHGPIAAVLANEWFGEENEDLANAVRYHTTGRIGMSPLEMVLCLADAIEPGRAYPGVDVIRQSAQENLVRALAESLDSTLQFLIIRHLPIFPVTVMARNDLWEQMRTSSR